MRSALWLVLFCANAIAAEPPTFVGCRQIADDSARLLCYDQAADALLEAVRGGPPPAAPAPSPATNAPPNPATADVPPTPAQPPPADVTPESIFGKEQAATEKVVKQVLGVEQTSSVTSRVTSVTHNQMDKLRLVLENGQVWGQLDDTKLTLKVGDTVVIRTASFGSYLLEKASGSRHMRVKRID